MVLKPGEIRWAYLEAPQRRPIIVLSREELNRGRTVVAVPITSSQFERRSRLPNCVPFRCGEFGLTKECVAQGESISLVSVDEIEAGEPPIGVLTSAALRNVIKAVGYVLHAECEPA